MKLLLPTYDRPKKLYRTLKFYEAEISHKDIEICVLDGAEGGRNLSVVRDFPGVKHIHRPKTSFLERLQAALEHMPDSELICLGNDEDVFCSEYLENSRDFLRENPEYSAFIGRYFTLSKPLFRLHRATHLRTRATKVNLNYERPEQRVNFLSHMLLSGCSPLFFGVRRAIDYKKSIEIQKDLQIETSQEIIDQLYLALRGKIMFTDDLMLLRDETKIGYQYYQSRHNDRTYFQDVEFDTVREILASELSLSSAERLSVELFCDVRSTKVEVENVSLAINHVTKEICKHSSYLTGKQSRNVFWLSKLLCLIEELVHFRLDKRSLKYKIGRHFDNWCKIVKH